MNEPGAMPLGTVPIGARVVVRHQLPDGRATDSLGELVARDEGTVTVRTKRALDAIEIDRVIAWRLVPPAPAARSRRS